MFGWLENRNINKTRQYNNVVVDKQKNESATAKDASDDEEDKDVRLDGRDGRFSIDRETINQNDFDLATSDEGDDEDNQSYNEGGGRYSAEGDRITHPTNFSDSDEDSSWGTSGASSAALILFPTTKKKVSRSKGIPPLHKNNTPPVVTIASLSSESLSAHVQKPIDVADETINPVINEEVVVNLVPKKTLIVKKNGVVGRKRTPLTTTTTTSPLKRTRNMVNGVAKRYTSSPGVLSTSGGKLLLSAKK